MIGRVSIIALFALMTFACASNDHKASAPASENGSVSVFNGKDLTGWTYGSAKGKELKVGEGYRVRDGVLYCTVADGGNLYTKKEYDNFIFRFEFKMTPDANNGIAIRAPLDGNSAYMGMEIQILDDSAKKYAQLRPVQYHGSIYDVVAAEKGHLKPIGEWNEEEITANGRHITVKLNGATIVDADLDDVKDPDILKKHPGLQNRGGHIGFLGHGADIEFRNLSVKTL